MNTYGLPCASEVHFIPGHGTLSPRGSKDVSSSPLLFGPMVVYRPLYLGLKWAR